MSADVLENAGLGPCELQDPVWVKMSTTVSGGANKKRKKTDTKPQSQINKCLNEKRRREQENIYIEELAELISASFADMSSLSVKPDKCAILQETVNQIRHIKQQEGSSSDAVQQGEVSSSKPTILANEVITPFMLEALEGFLFVVNTEDKVEYVTENVSQYIRYSKDEVLGESIYNIIHHGDHMRFSSSLLPMSIGLSSETQTRNRSFTCRFLIKPPDDQDETMEEKQQRMMKYENMQISSTLLPYPSEKVEGAGESGEVGPYLLCVARRIPQNEKNVGIPIEQFTTKLDTTGKIVGVDNTGVSNTYTQYLNKDLVGHIIQELCHHQDLHKLTLHLKEVLHTGSSTSAFYRLRVSAADKFVHVQTKSKLFKSNSTLGQEPDFIMSTHSIIGDNELETSHIANNSSSSSVGGPLMSGAAVNGSDSGNTITLNTGSTITTFTLGASLNEFDLFPSSTWDLVEPETVQPPQPRAPSTPGGYSSPHAFPFSPLQDGPAFLLEETKPEPREEPKPAPSDSARLRNLLMKRPEDGGGEERNQILKGLLDEDDDTDATSANKSSSNNNNNNNNNNNMLLKLLNEKSEDDDLEQQKKNELLQQLMKKEDEELKIGSGPTSEDQLLKSLGFPNRASPSPPREPLGGLNGGRKRHSDEGDEQQPASKMLHSQPQVTSTGNSKLWEKNRMLASLLAIQPSTPATIPPMPTSIITATPQEKLPRIGDRLKQNPAGWSGGVALQPVPSRPTQQLDTRPHLQQQQPRQQQHARHPGSDFLNHMLSRPEHHAHKVQQPRVEHFGGEFRAQDPSAVWDSQSSDPLLSDILDQVIDIVPDAIITDSTTILNILDAIDESPSSMQQDMLNEKKAIHAIQKALMQCESDVNSPVSPTLSLPGTPPAYTATTMTSQASQQPGGFPPPPGYPQRPKFALQQTGGLMGVRQGAPQYGMAPNTITNQNLILQQRKMLQQQQQKHRLLQQQQQQQLLIPSNAAAADQLGSGLQTMDSLLNNTVAPNVSLQRSSSVPDSQLSPSYGGQMLNSGGGQISPVGQRLNQQPYSPHSQQGFSPVSVGLNNFAGAQQGAQARLSPHSFQQSQLSPRISQGQPVYPTMSQGQTSQPPTNWSQAASRLSLQQQQNPMLNAQLTGNYGNGGRAFQRQQQQQQQQQQAQSPQQQLPSVRSLPSPGGPRQSPYPPEQFPPPASPTGYQGQGQYRLQRTISVPTATTQLPGGLNLPRHYGLKQDPHPHPHHPAMHPIMYQQHPAPDSSPQFCFDQGWASERGRPQAHTPTNHQPGGGNSGRTSEYVRQELRAIVGARTQQQSDSGGQQGGPRPPQQLQLGPGQQVSSADLEALGLTFEMANTGASEGGKLWGNLGTELESPQQGLARNTMEESPRASDHKSSLLQKLLSE